MPNKPFDSERGALLIELIISVTLFAFVAGEMASFWTSSKGWFQSVRDRSNLDREARVARELLIDQIIDGSNFSGTDSLTFDNNGTVEFEAIEGNLTYTNGLTSITAAQQLDTIATESPAANETKATFTFKQDTRQSTLKMWISEVP